MQQSDFFVVFLHGLVCGAFLVKSVKTDRKNGVKERGNDM